MITIPQLRTHRYTLELKELTFEQAITAAGIKSTRIEATNTHLLRYAVKSVKGVDSDPINWTVQERMTAVSWYMAHTRSDGVNFPTGGGFYSDFFDDQGIVLSPEITRIELGEHGGDKWFIQHLTGVMAESIERLLTSFEHPPYLHWLIGGMAAQLITDKEKPVKFELEHELDEWLEKRIKTFLAYPDSDFESLMLAYRINKPRLDHMMSVDFDQYGICVHPAKQEEKGGKSELIPTRFRASACLSRTARDMAQRPL